MLTGRIARNENRNQSRNGNTRAEDISYDWHELFLIHRDALALVARILVDGPCSPAVILFNAEARIKDSAVPPALQYVSAIRMVVLTALTMPSLGPCADRIEMFCYRNAALSDLEVRMGALPFRERCVVFLRDVLGYSRRETALLLNTDGSHVDDLLFFARKRLALLGGLRFDTVEVNYAPGGPIPRAWTTDEALLGCA